MVPKKGVVKIDADEELQATNRGLETTVREPTAKLEKAKGELDDLVEKLRLMFESITDALIVADLKGNIVEVNESTLRMTGYDKEAFIGRNALDFIAEKDHARAMEALWSTLEEGRSIEGLEYTVLAADGSEFEAEFSGAVLHDSSGNPAGFIGIARDITERRRAEQELVRLSNAVRMSTDSIVISDLEANIVEVNEATLKMFGTDDKADLVGKNALELIAPEDREKALAGIQEVLERGYNENVEYHILNKDGTRILVEMSSAIMKGVDGKPTGFVAVSRDISERKRIEDALRESEQKLRSVFEAMSDAVAVTDILGNIVEVNEATLHLHGYSRKEDLIGKNALDLVAEKDRARVMEGIGKAVGEGSAALAEYAVLTKDGEEVEIEASAAQLRDGSGNPVGLIAIIRDITERKRMEKALRESEERLSKFLSSSPDPCTIWDSELNLLVANEYSVYRPTGTNLEGFVGKNILELAPSIKETGRYDKYLEVIKTGEPLYCDDVIPDPQFGDLHMSVRAFKVGDGLGMIVSDVTERKRAEEALQESQEKLRRMFESVNDGIVVTDLNAIITDVNEKALQLSGLSSKNDIVGKNALSTIAQRDQEKALANMQELLQQEVVGTAELTLVKMDGSEYATEISANVLKDASGYPVGFVSVIRDITERKRAEQELIRLSNAVRMSTDSIVISDLEANILEVNEATLKMFGTDDKADLVGKNALELIAPEDRKKTLAARQEVLEKGYDENVEYHIITKDGSRVLVAMSTAIMKGVDGKPTGFVAVSRDISERKRMEEALHESEHKYRALFESGLDGVAVVDAETLKVVLCNQVAAKTYGFDSAEDLIGVNPLDFIHPDDRERALRITVEDMLEKDLRQVNEFRTITKDGKEKWISAIGTVIEYQGKLAAFASFSDITEQKKLQRIARERTTKLEKAKRELEDTASHLNTLQTVTEAGLSQMGLDNMLRELIRRLVQGIGGSFGIIWLLDEESGELRIRSIQPLEGVELSLEDLTLDVKNNLFGEVLRSAPSLFLGEEDFPSLPISDKLREALKDTQTKSLMAIPLRYQGKAIGAVCCGWDESRDFTLRETELLEVIADRAATAIEFHRLNEETRQKSMDLEQKNLALEETASHLSALQAITEVGLTQMGIDEMLQELLNRFLRGVGTPFGIIWLVDEERGQLRTRASLLAKGVELSAEDFTLDIRNSSFGALLTLTTPLLVEEKDFPSIPMNDRLKKALNDTQVKSLMLVPLTYQGKVIGIACCGWKKRREFTPQEIGLLEVIADRAANAIEFHRLNEETRQKSEALRESEEKLRIMFESIGDGIVVSDLEGNIVEVNEAVLRLSGFSHREELIGRSTFDFIAEKDRASILEHMIKSIEEGHRSTLEYTLLTKDGREYDGEASGAPLRDSSGNPAGFIGVIRDITERKRVEETLRVKDSAISSSINAVALADLEGNLTYVNASFLKLWGYENEEEVMGKPAIEFWQMGEQAAAVIEALFKKGGWQGELVASRKDRAIFDVQVSASMVTNEAGQPICMMSSFIDISERKRAEEALRESEERLRAFIENAPDAIYINDLTGTLLDGNRQAEELIGYSREEIIGKNFVEAGLLPEEYLPASLAGLEKNIRGEASGPDEFELITKDGSRVFVEIRTFPIARKGNVEVLGIARDITERKRAEEALKQSEERYRRFIEDIDDAYVLVDIQEGNALFTNARCAELLGYTVEEIIGQPLDKFVPPEAMQEVAEQFAMVLEGEAPVTQYETEVIDKQGIRIPVEVSTKITEHEGRIASGAIIRDITERKRAEEALRESEERYRTILEDIEDGYYEVDIAGNFTFFNDPMCGIIGYSRDEMIGMNNRQYMDKQNAKRVYQAFNRAFTTGIPSKEFGWEITRKDGAKRFIETSVSPIKNSKGEPIGFRGIVRDSTERKRAEEEIRQKSVELEQKNIDLERASELKSEFLANMSHELRTPMNAIMGYTSLMRRERYGTVTEKQAEALERVDRNAKNLLSLINNILDISKIEAGKMPIHNEEVDLRELVDEVTTTVEPMVREAKLALETTMTGDIPALWTDRSKLKQTILNLLSNAVKFTPKGGITVSAWGSDGHVKVAVSDTGIGIRDEDLNLIFEQFRQVDGSTTRQQGGTGLGLPLAKKFAKLLGGDIEVESVYGQGSTFTITIPCIAPRQTPRDIPEPIAEMPAKPITVAKTILVIDDDPEIVALVRENLSDTDYEVAVALSGEEGIKMASDLQPFAITLDILMPHRDGWYVIHKLKNNPQTAHIPVIIMSIIEEKALAYSLGVADYIVKPIERDLLVTTLKRLERAGRKEALVVDDDPKVVNLLRDILEGEGYIVREALSGREAISKIETKPPDYLFLDIGMPEINGFDVLNHVWEKTYDSEMIIVITSAAELAPEKRDFLSKWASIVIEKSGLHTKEAVEALKLALIAAQANKGVQGNENEAEDSGGRRQRR